MGKKEILFIILGINLFIITFLFIGYTIGGIKGYNKGEQNGAMEVYKGNTKLQYTIVDSVKVDSCVIFLNK